MIEPGSVAAWVVMVITSAMNVALTTISLHYAYADEDSTCQKGNRAGMILSEWLKFFAFSNLAVNVVAVFFAGIIKKLNEKLTDVVVALSVVYFFVETIIMWIIGVVIVSTDENNTCVSEGKAMAVMSIINLCVVGPAFAASSTVVPMVTYMTN